jgi:hypothetical protein
MRRVNLAADQQLLKSLFTVKISLTMITKAEFLDIIGTKVLIVFLLAIHSDLHRLHTATFLRTFYRES